MEAAAPRVLLVEDSNTMREVSAAALRAGGYEVEFAADGGEAVRAVRTLAPDIVVLDVHLPVMDGWDVLAAIRERDHQLPVLMLTGTAPDEASRVRGLVSGADDYVIKPVGGAELRARVGALLRRARQRDGDAARPEPRREAYDDGSVRLDYAGARVEIDGAEVRLTPGEFRLLEAFVEHPGEALSAQRLLELVWADHSGEGAEKVKVYVGYLRRKLAEATDRELIETVRGFGYRYAPPA